MNLDEEIHATKERIRAITDLEEMHEMVKQDFYNPHGHGLLKDHCPICHAGMLVYRSSRSYGNPDHGSFQNYEIYECDRCGFVDERDVS